MKNYVITTIMAFLLVGIVGAAYVSAEVAEEIMIQPQPVKPIPTLYAGGGIVMDYAPLALGPYLTSPPYIWLNDETGEWSVGFVMGSYPAKYLMQDNKCIETVPNNWNQPATARVCADGTFCLDTNQDGNWVCLNESTLRRLIE